MNGPSRSNKAASKPNALNNTPRRGVKTFTKSQKLIKKNHKKKTITTTNNATAVSSPHFTNAAPLTNSTRSLSTVSTLTQQQQQSTNNNIVIQNVQSNEMGSSSSPRQKYKSQQQHNPIITMTRNFTTTQPLRNMNKNILAHSHTSLKSTQYHSIPLTQSTAHTITNDMNNTIIMQADLSSITTLQSLITTTKRSMSTSVLNQSIMKQNSNFTIQSPSYQNAKRIATRKLNTMTKKLTSTKINRKKLFNQQLTALITTARRNFTTATPDQHMPSPEDVTQGANLVQLQQAVNQWAHLNYRGMEFLRSGTPSDLDNAESCFNECANAMEQYPLLPCRSLSLANLASCLMRKGHYKEAIKLFQPLTQQLLLYKQVSIQHVATIHMELASAYELSGQHDLAVKELYVGSSRFVVTAANHLAQIQASDTTHFHLSRDTHPSALSLEEQQQQHFRTKAALDGTQQTPPQHEVLREDERSLAYSNALDCWRTALGCRYSAVALQHRMANFEFAATELKKLSSVYKYFIDCCEVVQKHRWDNGEGEDGDVGELKNEKGEYVDIDKSLVPHPDASKIIAKLPLCPPEARVVTSDLVKLFPDISLHHLNDLYARITVEYVSVLHSLANVLIDQGLFEQACTTLQHSVDVMNPMDEQAFLKVASESSKTLRLLYEKLLLEQQNYTDANMNEPCVIQVSDNAKIKFDNRAAVESSIKMLNTTRANILALFTTYIQGHVLQTKAPLDKEMFGSTADSRLGGVITGASSNNPIDALSFQLKNVNFDNINLDNADDLSPTGQSSYQSSASSSTISLDDLPPDAQKFINLGKDKIKQELSNGQFYEHMRDVYKRELGPQFREDLPELLKLKPDGYKALHEREFIGDNSHEKH